MAIPAGSTQPRLLIAFVWAITEREGINHVTVAVIALARRSARSGTPVKISTIIASNIAVSFIIEQPQLLPISSNTPTLFVRLSTNSNETTRRMLARNR